MNADGLLAARVFRFSRQPTGVWPAAAGAPVGAEAKAAVAAARAAQRAALKGVQIVLTTGGTPCGGTQCRGHHVGPPVMLAPWADGSTNRSLSPLVCTGWPRPGEPEANAATDSLAVQVLNVWQVEADHVGSDLRK